MDRLRNPYSPGAGTPPPTLVGRDKQLDDMDVALRRLLMGRSVKSVLLTGLRGVGKTVLLVEFGRQALELGYIHEHVEAQDGTRVGLVVAEAVRKIVLRLNAMRRFQEHARRVLGVLKAFSLQLPDGTRMRLDVDPIGGPADSGDLGSDLAGLFAEVGQLARQHSTGVLITIDEIQYLPPEDLGALMVGLHRVAQLRLPFAIAGAGLPSLPGLSGEAKSYSERMFDFSRIDSLPESLANDALGKPAQDEDVRWESDALHRVVAVTQGYPYFLQEFGKQSWDVAPGPGLITLDDVEASVPLAMAELDSGFFRVRVDKTTEKEREYLLAMARLGAGPYLSADVATALGRTTPQLGPVRDSLIKRGLCYAPRWGQLAFTVPMFDGFLLRWLEQG